MTSASAATISGSPHIHGELSVKRIMYTVTLALVPAFLSSIYFFGWDAIRVTAIAVASCVLTEWIIQKYLIKGECTINDGSAVLTGVLLAFNIPSSMPWWMIVVGSIVAIGIAKMSFGGLGKNPFNPALVGRVFMLISFPAAMTTWPSPSPIFKSKILDAVSGPTPLGVLKEGGVEALTSRFNYWDMLIDNYGGSLGEISAIAIIIGGVYLIIRKIIDWQTPVIIIGTVTLVAGICWLIDPSTYVNPLFHVLGGGLLDGINPCAFATSIFLISYLLYLRRSRRDILLVGACFCLGVFLTYFLFGFALSVALRQLQQWQWVKSALFGLFGVAGLVLCALHLRDALIYRRTGRASDMDMGLSKNTHRSIHERIRRLTTVRVWLLGPAALALGAIISAMELACTGQVYFPVIAALSEQGLNARFVLLLLLYNVCFILPLAVITVLAAGGVGAKSLGDWAKRHLVATKVSMAVLFAVLGVLMLTIAVRPLL